MRWSVTTPPTGTVLTWDQLKAHVRPGSISEQPYLMDLLASATTYAESLMELCLLPQTVTAIYDLEDVGWYSENFAYFGTSPYCRQGLQLPRGPILSITSVLDANDGAITYQRRTEGNADYIQVQQVLNPSQLPLTVVFQAGFEVVPADIATAIRVHVATLYSIREDVTNLSANPVHKIDNFYRYRGRGCTVM